MYKSTFDEMKFSYLRYIVFQYIEVMYIWTSFLFLPMLVSSIIINSNLFEYNKDGNETMVLLNLFLFMLTMFGGGVILLSPSKKSIFSEHPHDIAIDRNRLSFTIDGTRDSISLCELRWVYVNRFDLLFTNPLCKGIGKNGIIFFCKNAKRNDSFYFITDRDKIDDIGKQLLLAGCSRILFPHIRTFLFLILPAIGFALFCLIAYFICCIGGIEKAYSFIFGLIGCGGMILLTRFNPFLLRQRNAQNTQLRKFTKEVNRKKGRREE